VFAKPPGGGTTASSTSANNNTGGVRYLSTANATAVNQPPSYQSATAAAANSSNSGYSSYLGNGNNAEAKSVSNSSSSSNQSKNNFNAVTPLDKLTRKLQQNMQDFFNESRSEIQTELMCQAKLEKNGADAEVGIAALKRLKAELTTAISTVESKTKDLTVYLSEQSEKNVEINVDSLITPVDTTSQQMLGLCAQNHTHEDTLYYLDRWLASGNTEVDVNQYLKEVRKCARKQFLTKAHIKKIIEEKGGSSSYVLR
jgi:hypothetical protein